VFRQHSVYKSAVYLTTGQLYSISEISRSNGENMLFNHAYKARRSVVYLRSVLVSRKLPAGGRGLRRPHRHAWRHHAMECRTHIYAHIL